MNFCFLFFKWISVTLLLTACSPVSSAPASSSSVPTGPADLSLISVVTSRNGNVSYVNLSPLHYEAEKKGLDPIKISPEDPQRDRPMELIIYSTCNRGDPQKEAALGWRAKFLGVNFLLSPHPDDLPAAYYLSPTGLFRMGKEAVKGHPYFKEEGSLKISGDSDKLWKVNIQRSDTTAVNSKTDYRIELSKEMDQPLFIEALKSAAKPSVKGILQVTVSLESPSLSVKATYNLVHKGARQYQPIQKMSIIEWWSKQQTWCPDK